MSMMVLGMILADIDLKDFWDWTVVKYTVHRLVIIPAVVYLVCRMLPLSKTVLGLCVFLAAMPAGATTSILAEKYQVTPFLQQDGYFFHLTVTSDHLPVEHLPAVKYTLKQQCVQFSFKIVTTHPPYRLVEGMLFLYNEKI